MNDKALASLDPREFAASALRHYGRQLHDFLRRRVRQSGELDDLAQEVYLRLLRVHSVDTIRNPLAYIYGVASHVVSEFHMRDSRRKVVFDSTLAESEPEPGSVAQPGTHAEGGLQVEIQVNEALRQLPPKQLAVLLLERREGLSHAEIADRLGLSPHTVKKYSVQALAQVRASLDR